MDPILYLVHRFPFPPDKGDRIRAYHILQFLAKRSPVHLATLADEPVTDEARASLQKLCVNLIIAPLPRTRFIRMLWSLATGRTASEGAFASGYLCDVLKGWCQRFSYRACIISASSLTPYLSLKELQGMPAIVDLVDVDSQKWLDYSAFAQPPLSWIYSLEGRRLRRLESELAVRSRAITLVSDAEADIIRQFVNPGRIEVITNGVDLDYFHPQPEMGDSRRESTCVFVGTLDYWPNVEAICWFCREVWPGIYRRNDQARLSVVGRRPVKAVRRLQSCPGVDVVGQVEDVRPYYARSAVAVAPLRIARGVQNKLLEALATGKAVVTSPSTMRGLKVEPGKHLLKADSTIEWEEAILRLLNDSPLRNQLGVEGRRFVEEHHRWDRCLEPLGRLMDEVTCAASGEDRS
jgi:sugar transferase (PEP-CTERM/EpsH1 system associated)